MADMSRSRRSQNVSYKMGVAEQTQPFSEGQVHAFKIGEEIQNQLDELVSNKVTGLQAVQASEIDAYGTQGKGRAGGGNAMWHRLTEKLTRDAQKTRSRVK